MADHAVTVVKHYKLIARVTGDIALDCTGKQCQHGFSMRGTPKPLSLNPSMDISSKHMSLINSVQMTPARSDTSMVLNPTCQMNVDTENTRSDVFDHK